MPITLLENRCKLNEYAGAKIISLSPLSSLFDLMKQGVKVIHLVRDPRSAWLSRPKITATRIDKEWDDYVKFVQGQLVENPGVLDNGCGDLAQDLPLLKEIHNSLDSGNGHLLDNYKLVRYEDVALDPSAWVKSMYKFLKTPIHKNVLKWIKENTNGSDSDSSR